MKKLTLLLLLSLSSVGAFGQVISGHVYDKETNEPIDYASVYINGTFLGTTTDQNGAFELDVTEYPGRTLYISAIGYNTASLSTVKESESHQVLLVKAVYEISEVSIESQSLAKERRRSMQIFKKEFLGSSNNAKECFILNEDIIKFNYQSNQDTLRATAHEPLLILNKSLGYQITYYLDKFEYEKGHKTTTFLGNISFNRDLASNQDNRKDFEQRRKKTYIGSSKHFFSSLWANNHSAEGFYVNRVGIADALSQDEFVIVDSQGKKYLIFSEDLEIAYDYSISTVHFLQSKAFFDKDGFFDPQAIMWYGYMSHSRVADWLPYEYAPKQ
jgi:hypothetical protein